MVVVWNFFKRFLAKAVLSLCVLFVLFGCKKEETKQLSQQPELQIAELLNQSRPQEALDLIAEKELESPDNVDLKYWKAQALSMRAGVDVYSLFPLLKIKLFEVAMNEWSTMSRFEQRSRQQNTIGMLGQRDGENSLSEEELKKNLHILGQMDPREIPYEAKTLKYTESLYRYNGQDFINCLWSFSITSEVMPKDMELIHYEPSMGHTTAGECEGARSDVEAVVSDSNYIRNWIKEETLKRIEEKINNIRERNEMENMLKAGFALFDSLPIIRSIPALKEESIQDLKEALEILQKIRQTYPNDHRYGKNARQQIGLLAGYLILGPLRNTLDFDQIQEPLDIVCHVDHEHLLKFYKHTRLGMTHLLPIIEETEVGEKNKKNLKAAKEILKELPSELTPDEKENIINGHNYYKSTNC